MPIPPEDRVSYKQARQITGRSHGYLFRLVNEGRLSRDGGRPGQAWTTFLSRAEVEALAIAEYSPHRRTDYWMKVNEAAKALEGVGADGPRPYPDLSRQSAPAPCAQP